MPVNYKTPSSYGYADAYGRLHETRESAEMINIEHALTALSFDSAKERIIKGDRDICNAIQFLNDFTVLRKLEKDAAEAQADLATAIEEAAQ